MQQPGGSTLSAQKSSGDIVFACTHCAASFVVDSAAAGMTLDCQKCGKPTTVPNPELQAAAGNALKISDLQHQLKENESQRIEITGYINQLSIQLHRWQLRLQTLKERQQKLQAEVAAICGPPAK
jgi:transcription elongation factor Elf1